MKIILKSILTVIFFSNILLGQQSDSLKIDGRKICVEALSYFKEYAIQMEPEVLQSFDAFANGKRVFDKRSDVIVRDYLYIGTFPRDLLISEIKTYISVAEAQSLPLPAVLSPLGKPDFHWDQLKNETLIFCNRISLDQKSKIEITVTEVAK